MPCLQQHLLDCPKPAEVQPAKAYKACSGYLPHNVLNYPAHPIMYPISCATMRRTCMGLFRDICLSLQSLGLLALAQNVYIRPKLAKLSNQMRPTSSRVRSNIAPGSDGSGQKLALIRTSRPNMAENTLNKNGQVVLISGKICWAKFGRIWSNGRTRARFGRNQSILADFWPNVAEIGLIPPTSKPSWAEPGQNENCQS